VVRPGVVAEWYQGASPPGPALRNLAEDLEVQLNNAIGDLKRLDKEHLAEAPEFAVFTNDAFEELLDICEDLPALFYAATTTHRDRKEILRTMIDRVRIVERTPEIIRVLVFWADGTAPTAVEALLFRFAHRMIRELAEQGFSNVEIAKRLNEMGLVTSRGKPWTREVVWVVRHYGKGGKQAAQKRRKAS
jgi:Recombinase